MIWNSADRFGYLLITFVTTLVLGNLLDPHEFGVVGMLYFFLAMSDTFIDGGLGAALIQKDKPTQADYSTIFFWNIVVSLVLMVVLFFTAPLIASFYRMPELIAVLRVNSLVLLFHALAMIQKNILVKSLEFKRIAYQNLLATFLSAVVAIAMAYWGCSYWSLVAKSLVSSGVFAVMLWITTKWRPKFLFNWQSFKSLFSFSSLLLLSHLVETAYVNIQSLIIGRLYSDKELGLYTQANKMVEIPIASLSTIVNQVVFPVFSRLQNDYDKLRATVSKNVKAITYLNFPICVLLMVAAEPLFGFLLPDKWSNSVPYFQYLCVSGMMYALNTINTNIFKSMGKGKLFFLVQFVKRSAGIILIVIGLQFGVMGMMAGVASAAYAFWLISAFMAGKTLDYGIIRQLKDIAPNYLLSFICGLGAWCVKLVLNVPDFPLLLMQTIVFLSLYLSISYYFKLDGLFIYWEIAKERVIEPLRKRRNRG